MQIIAVAVMLAALQFGGATEVTPVQKVLQLMSGMLEKGKLEKNQEQVQFAAYKQFCDDTSAEKKTTIAAAEEKMEVLKANIQKYTAAAAKLGKEIKELDADVALWTGDIKAATAVRNIEKADNNKLLKDYAESIDALNRAIVVLKARIQDRKQKALIQEQPDPFDSFMQLSALKNKALIPEEVQQHVDTLLQAAVDDFEGKPKTIGTNANAYEFQSSGVIEMLEKLLDKFTAEQTAKQKVEMNSRHAYDMLMQDLKAQIDQAKKDSSSKSVVKAKKLEKKGEAFGNLKDTGKTVAADKAYLADLVSTCGMKTTDFQTRQQLRAEEITAIEQAIQIISGNKVSGSAKKHLPKLVQLGKGSSFGQLRVSSKTEVRAQLVQYLQSKSQEINSQLLSALSEKVGADPFKKVKKLLKDLIVRLMQEANQEAEHKGWCDKELATNKQTRKEKSDAVETLKADIDELEAASKKVAQELKDLSKAISDLDAAVLKATKLRQEEKAKNTATIKDASEAQVAVAQAVTVIKEFYAKAGQSTALIQQSQAPAIFGDSYKGMESTGVVGMLEVIESDFARLESDTKAGEASAGKQYDTFASDSKVDKAQKQKMIENKTAKAQDQKQALQVKKADMAGTVKELEAAMAYFEKLKPSCVNAGVSYQERVARRKDEISSLQEALKILNGEDIA